MNEQQSVEDYGHCIIRIRMCVIFIFGESWTNYMNFGGYIDINLERLEIMEGQQCAVIHWTPGSWRWNHCALFKHQIPNAQHSTTSQKKQDLNFTCHGICYIWELCVAVVGYFQQLRG
jgi:hypothetical protein